MKQPDLGLKVTELRQEKGITQEQLAEHCEVSTRTIQRIESGEVDPRSFTINMLSEVLEFDFSKDHTGSDNLWIALLHLSCAISNIIIPLLIWSWKKNQSYKIDKHGRLVLNFQITITLMLIAAVILLLAFPAFLIAANEAGFSPRVELGLLALLIPLPLILVGIFATYQGVVNAYRALNDQPVKYALAIPFLK